MKTVRRTAKTTASADKEEETGHGGAQADELGGPLVQSIPGAL